MLRVLVAFTVCVMFFTTAGNLSDFRESIPWLATMQIFQSHLDNFTYFDFLLEIPSLLVG